MSNMKYKVVISEEVEPFDKSLAYRSEGYLETGLLWELQYNYNINTSYQINN